MKVDLYTKIVLTIIALSLLVIASQRTSLIPTAHAQTGVVDVRVVEIVGAEVDDGSPVMKVQLVGVERDPKLYWESVNVRARDW